MDEKFRDVDRFHQALANLAHVERESFRNLIGGCLDPTLRERHLTYSYQRAAINVELLVAITDSRQFQAMTMLTRAIFEISVEMAMISREPNASEKIEAFNNIEKMRAANKIVNFAGQHPGAAVHSDTYRQFLSQFEAAIRAEHARLWPGTKMSNVQHWTLRKLDERAKEAGDIFDQLYQVNYSELSWFAHGGTTGVMTMTSEAAAYLTGQCFKLAADAYAEILEIMIKEFRLEIVDDIIRTRIEHARFDPFAETPEEKAALLKAMGVVAKN